MTDTGKQTKVFRAEILKPVNYTWAEFSSIINKATYYSARLANEVITKKFLLGRGEIQQDSTFCSMVTLCKDTPLSFDVKCAVCQRAKFEYRSLARKLHRSDISLPTFKNNSLYVVAKGVTITKCGDDEWVVRMSILPGVRGKGANHPKVILRTKGLAERDKGYYRVLERIVSKEYKLGFCQLRKDKSRGKMYLLMSYTFGSTVATSPVPTRVMGVDLGVATPAYCAFNDSVKRLSLFLEGDKLLRVKSQIQHRRRCIARETTKWNSRKGHGLSGKSYPIQAISQKWVNFRLE